MLQGYEKTIESITKELEKKLKKKLQVDILIHLIKKLEHTIAPDIHSLFTELEQELRTSVNNRKPSRAYKKQLATIQKVVEKQFGFVEAGALKERYMGMGIAIGVAIGAGTGTAFVNAGARIGVTIALGVVFGTFVGERLVKQASEKGLLY